MGDFRTNELIIDPALTLIVVEAVEFRANRTAMGGYLYANIAPIAVVVCRQDEITAWDIQARSASVEQLRRDIPELDTILST